jgi:RNA polymerase sigma factor for flagellar operon FliA
VLSPSPWQTYTKGQRQPVIEQMLSTYGHLVDYQVQRVIVDLPASVDRDDLASEARIGLIDAINRFDPSVNVKFETYASIRIKGAIVDYLRKLDWAPRSLRQRAREINAAESELEQQLGEKPNEQQLAGKLEMSVEQYRKTLSDLSVLSILSFRDLEENDGEFQVRSTGSEPEDSAARLDFSRCLATAIERLPERDKVVLDLYYRRSMSLKEIGQIMSLSESRICQIHSAAVLRLRQTLHDWAGEF